MLSLSDFQFDQDDGWSRSGWSRYRRTTTHTQREWFDRGSFFRQVDEGAPVQVEWRDLWLTGGLTEAGAWLRKAMPGLKDFRDMYMSHFSDEFDEKQYRDALTEIMKHLTELESTQGRMVASER